jgi:hypothetical protein
MISQARFAGDAAEPMPSKISAIGRFWWSLILAEHPQYDPRQRHPGTRLKSAPAETCRESRRPRRGTGVVWTSSR